MVNINNNQNTEKLKCSVCNKEIYREQNKLIRNCDHKNAPVISEMQAVMRGISKIT